MDNNIREDWTEDKLDLCRPDGFYTEVTPTLALSETLESDDCIRLIKKLTMVESIAGKLAANMLKGTLKYKRDSWSLDTWLDYLEDDAADALNYVFLAREARRIERGVADGSII